MSMETRSLFSQFLHSSCSATATILGVIAVGALLLALLAAGIVLFLGQTILAELPTPGDGQPRLTLDTGIAAPGAVVTARGQGWQPGQRVLIYLAAPGQSDLFSYPAGEANADAEGGFVVGFVVPSGPEMETQGLVTVTARAADGTASAQAFFSLPGTPATSQPQVPIAIATTNVNIRSGPGASYPVVGVLASGQGAEITGVSPDSGWWQIRFPGASDGRGWVSGSYVTVQNASNVPVVPSPAAPPAPTVPPVVITDWRGEYYANPNLSGNPALVRNDVAVGFEWGNAAPADGLPADGFSARWTRSLHFPAGVYRFYVRADDGARLWIDDNLIIDQWHDGAPTLYSADLTLGEGTHGIRMEYYERGVGAVAQLAWERLENYPDWKGEYWSNPSLSGSPALVRNDGAIDFNWGAGSPASGLPADNFSARWTRTWSVNGAGLYRFHLVADDGVRVWVDDNLVLDQWWDGLREETADYWLDDGTYSLRLEYYEHAGDARILLWAERVSEAPQADFDANPRSGTAPLEVKFDNDSSGDYDRCEWTFGDGDTDDECDSPSHTYAEAGKYTVELTVSGPGGEDSEKKGEYIVVE